MKQVITSLNCPPADYGDFIQENVSLRDKNWFNTGGNARYFAAPTTPL